MRGSISLVAVAFGLIGSLGAAAAQTYPPAYPPPPPGYYPPPPPAYYPPPGEYTPAPPEPYESAPLTSDPPGGPYGHAPFIYRDANGMAVGPAEPSYEDQAGPPAAGRPYFVPGEPPPRPPVDIGAAGAPAEVTGTIRNPPAAGAVQPDRGAIVAALPPEDQPEQGPAKATPPQFRRQLVDYATSEPAGTIIIDTPHTYLYLVLGKGKALRYGVGVGREGFTWSGSERVSRMSEWPDWHPPKEMIERQPYLPRFMAGGEGNPLGARALYLGNTVYRIHGTNQPSTIGSFVSSGCIRLTNEDVEDLYSRVNVGTRVVVLAGSPPISASSQGAITR